VTAVVHVLGLLGLIADRLLRAAAYTWTATTLIEWAIKRTLRRRP